MLNRFLSIFVCGLTILTAMLLVYDPVKDADISLP